MLNRYFIFTYFYPGGQGNLCVNTGGDKFPSSKYLKAAMALNACCKHEDIVVTGWNEFKNPSDYQDYIA